MRMRHDKSKAQTSAAAVLTLSDDGCDGALRRVVATDTALTAADAWGGFSARSMPHFVLPKSVRAGSARLRQSDAPLTARIKRHARGV
jgi:hypothetical protein